MTAPTFPTLVGSTLNRKWVFQIDTSGGSGTATWQTIGGVTNHTFNPDDANWEDDTDMQSGGYNSQAKTAAGFNIALTLTRKLNAAGDAYDVAQEYLRTHSIGVFGADNTVPIRIFEYDPNNTVRVEAYTGYVGCQWSLGGGGNNALDTASVTLNGQGALTLIAHPFPAT